MDLYNAGLDSFATWTTGTFKWLLMKSGAFNRDHDFVDDLVPGTNEVSVAGYARIATSTPVRAVNNTTDRINFTAADPDFGALAAGQTVTALVLILFVTNDADSIPIGWETVASTPTDAWNPFVVTLPSGVVAYMDQGA